MARRIEVSRCGVGRAVKAAMLLLLASVPAAGSAQGWELGPFTRPQGARAVIMPQAAATFTDPILKKAVAWESLHTFNPAAVVRGDAVFVLYRAEDSSGEDAIGGHTSRLGLASSADGVHFKQEPAPVFFPAEDEQEQREWPGGVEDPRIVEGEDGTYVLTYTQWNRLTYSVGVATSKDLRRWTKWGPAFGAEGRYGRLQYKSAGIVTERRGGKLIAAKMDGKYWLYWGEGAVRLATSGDLIHWTPVEDAGGVAKVLLQARPGLFDSGLPEIGPPPVLTSRGIVLIYNGKNADGRGGSKVADAAPELAPGAYSVGEALFAKDAPDRLLERTKTPVFKPELPWEQGGQYAAGTTFAEGLVYFKGEWLLYYGCADSLVGVAMAAAQ